MMVQYKLTYFNLTCIGEPIRMLFYYGGIKFEDIRFENEEWPALKPTMPLGQVPVLEVDGKKMFQSTAITRYVAKLVGLFGNDNWEDLQIDAMVDTIVDFRERIGDVYYEEDEAVKERKLKVFEKDILPFYLSKLEEIAKENNGHLALGRFTWADVYFAGIWPYYNNLVERDILADSPNLKKVIQNVWTHEKIKGWIATRPQTDDLKSASNASY